MKNIANQISETIETSLSLTFYCNELIKPIYQIKNQLVWDIKEKIRYIKDNINNNISNSLPPAIPSKKHP